MHSTAPMRKGRSNVAFAHLQQPKTISPIPQGTAAKALTLILVIPLRNAQPLNQLDQLPHPHLIPLHPHSLQHLPPKLHLHLHLPRHPLLILTIPRFPKPLKRRIVLRRETSRLLLVVLAIEMRRKKTCARDPESSALSYEGEFRFWARESIGGDDEDVAEGLGRGRR